MLQDNGITMKRRIDEEAEMKPRMHKPLHAKPECIPQLMCPLTQRVLNEVRDDSEISRSY